MKKPELHSAHVQVRYDWINPTGRWQADGASGNASLAPKYIGSTRSAVAGALDDVEARVDRRDPRIVLQLTLTVVVESVDEAIRLAEADWAPINVAEAEPMVALIPGRMCAEYKDGQVTKVWFAPAAGDIGYQGSSFFIHSGHAAYPDEEDDRPFWAAMGEHLSREWTVGAPIIEWEG